MQRVRVKIEGLRDPLTALKVAQMGADAIGLVFADSPRRVAPAEARAIVDNLPPWVAAVGVFVDVDPSSINRLAEQVGLHYAQLHGEEPPEYVDQIRIPCIKAFRVRDEGWLDEVRQWMGAVRRRSHLAAILLDAHNPRARGGTGERFNWHLVADARAGGAMAGLDPIILAGGLDASCVEAAIELVQPWAVDVASGVESAPGVKDLARVADFLRATQEGNELTSAFWL